MSTSARYIQGGTMWASYPTTPYQSGKWRKGRTHRLFPVNKNKFGVVTIRFVTSPFFFLSKTNVIIGTYFIKYD